MTFGEYLKQKRIESGQTLRGFCRKHNIDPGYVSKMERGIIPAPRSRDRIMQYAQYLDLHPKYWQDFCDIAAVSAGILPPDLADKEAGKNLPILFRMFRDEKIDLVKLEEIADIIRRE